MIVDIILYIIGGLALAALIAARVYEVEEQRRNNPPKDKDDNTRS